MVQDYFAIAVLIALATGLAILIVIIGHLFGPRRPNPVKQAPYESGMRSIGPNRRRMTVRFYLIAIFFILFDIEIMFILPWAVVFQKLGWVGFANMMVFIGLLTLGEFWLWKKGALEWL